MRAQQGRERGTVNLELVESNSYGIQISETGAACKPKVHSYLPVLFLADEQVRVNVTSNTGIGEASKKEHALVFSNLGRNNP